MREDKVVESFQLEAWLSGEADRGQGLGGTIREHRLFGCPLQGGNKSHIFCRVLDRTGRAFPNLSLICMIHGTKFQRWNVKQPAHSPRDEKTTVIMYLIEA